ncbi:MAG TPA: ABC transporter substrate-binding protein, partial [Gaiellales bacterium]|nr:ABC transporter substrate-binding protein [Gaiellales bacterium]
DQNWQLLVMTNDGLLAWKRVSGPQGNDLVPDLATSIPKPTDGGTTYLFHIRRGIRFSNGALLKPTDVTATLEREFKAHGPGGGFYTTIVGGTQCLNAPASCDLRQGVVANNAAGTVTFHLTAPDPEFLLKLALPFAYIVPAGSPNHDIGNNALPATGPYQIESYTTDQQMVFTRNPHFHQWSRAAQPAGYPDRIVMKIGLTTEAETTAVEQGQADWMYDQPPSDRLNEIATRYPHQVHVNPVPQQYYMSLNTRVPPFNNLDARRAVNYATDRSAVIKIWGGPHLAVPTCQILPPGFPAYQAYCPYTKNPGTRWTAPDMARARQLVAASGTRGDNVGVIVTTDAASMSTGEYFAELLNQLGYHATVKGLNSKIEYPYVQNSLNHPQISFSYWYPDYPAASDFLNVVTGCAGYHPASDASPNLSEFCDPAIQKQTVRALKIEQTDVPAANRLWTQIDRETTDQAPWISLFVPKHVDFVSSRLGNYQFSPSVVGNFLIDQAWVQ